MYALTRPSLFLLTLIPLLLTISTCVSAAALSNLIRFHFPQPPPNSISRQGNPSPVDAESYDRNSSYTYALRRGSVSASFNPTVSLDDDFDGKDVNVKFNILKGKNVLTQINTKSTRSIGNAYIVESSLQFSKFPGEVYLEVLFKDGDKEKREFATFHVVGIVIFDETPMKEGEFTLYTGRNADALHLEVPNATTGAFIKKYNVSMYRGSPETPHQLLDREISFQVPENCPVKWNKSDCKVATDPSELSDKCFIAFSRDYTQFFVRTTHNFTMNKDLEEKDRRIAITWTGLQTLSPESGVVSSPDEIEDNDIISEIRFEVARDSRDGFQASSRGSIPIVVIVITSVLLALALSTVVCCWCVCGKSRDARMDSMRVRGWFHGEVSSLRTTAGRTIGVFEDPLSNDAPMMGLGGHSDGRREYVGGTQRGGDRDSDGGYAMECDTDGMVPLDRLGEDKSVTKLVLPRGRGVRRGVELESSTDGGSGNGGGGGSDVASGGRRRRRALVRDSGADGGCGLGSGGSGTEGTTEPTGTVVVDEGVGDSGSRDGVEAAIDRVRQVDLLLGPASRGLVGRNGEPLLAKASLEDVDAKSKMGPDSGIVPLSVLS